MGHILYYVREILYVMLAAAPVAAVLRLAARPLRRRRGLRTTPWHEAGTAVLILFIVGLLSLTVSFGQLRDLGLKGSVNLIPLATIRLMLDNLRHTHTGATYWGVLLTNLLGNVLVFVPVGLLPPILWRRCDRLWAAAGIGLGLSLFIEVAQLFCYRATDVDDLILNTLGAALGFLVWRLLRRAAPGVWARFRLSGGPQ